jgi:hypothetical protein
MEPMHMTESSVNLKGKSKSQKYMITLYNEDLNIFDS